MLEEAAALAASPEARQTVERADEDDLLGLQQQQVEQQDAGVPEITIQAGVDVETVIALAELSDEDIQLLRSYVPQIIRVLTFVVSLALVGNSEFLSLEQAAAALGAAMAFWDFLRALGR